MRYQAPTDHARRPGPPAIEARETPDGVLFVLPARSLGRFRFVGLAWFSAALPFTGFMVARIASGVIGPLSSEGLSIDVVFGIFLAISILLIGGGLAATGLLVFAGHGEVELTRDRIRGIERCGPLRWSRAAPLERLRRFKVERAEARINGRPVEAGPMAGLGRLQAEFEGRAPLTLVAGYPFAWLEALARDLARRREKAGAGEIPSKGVSVQGHLGIKNGESRIKE